MMQEENQKLPTDNKRRWMRIVLVVSLGMNILVVGMVGGAVFHGGPPSHFRPDPMISALGLRPYFRGLDAAGREDLRSAVNAGKGRFKAGREGTRAHLTALARLLTAEPYDPALVAAELARQAETVSGNVQFGHQLLIERIAALTVEQRKAMAAALLAAPSRRGGRP